MKIGNVKVGFKWKNKIKLLDWGKKMLKMIVIKFATFVKFHNVMNIVSWIKLNKLN